MIACTCLTRTRLALLVGLAIVLGMVAPADCPRPAYGQRPERLESVAVSVRVAPKGSWWEHGNGTNWWDHVNITNDNDFIAKRFHADDYHAHNNVPSIQHNFRPGANTIDGFLLSYDLDGKSKNVVWRQGDRVSTRWEIETAGRFSIRLQARDGSLKGWWVGLKVLKEKAEPGKPAQARLVLVKDKKDAAVFTYEDPTDISP